MKHRIFYGWLMIALFAVVSFGGCGGSSTAYFSEPEAATTHSSITMKEAMTSADVIQKIFDQIISNDAIILGLTEVKLYQISVSGDGQIWMQDGSITGEKDAPALYDAHDLHRHYDSEDVILLEEPDIALINKVRTDLGEVSEDSSIVGSSGYLEVYAMARISSGNSFQSFTYSVPAMSDIVRSEGTSSEQDSSQSAIDILSVDQAITGESEAVYTAVDFVVERWVNFFAWVSSFGLRNVFGEELSSAVFSDAAAMKEEADKQEHMFDFSYTDLKADGITYDDWDKSTTAFTMSRINQLNMKVYAAHSFKTGNDYYFVQSTATTKPKNYKSVKVSPMGSAYDPSPYLYGYTKYLGFEAWLDGSTASNVSIVASNPGNLKGSPSSAGAKYTETTSHNITSWTGVHQYTGPFAIDGAEYSNTQTWVPHGWDMVNRSGANHPASAGWYADVYLPANAWGTLMPSGGSTSMLSYNTDWVWEVKPAFWKNHKTVKLNVDFEVRDGATIASYPHAGKQYDRADKWFGNKQRASVILTPPPHTSARLVGRSLSMPLNSLPLALYNLGAAFGNRESVPFSYTLDEKADTLTLKVLAEEPWTLSYKTSDGGNWATLSGTSGLATGADGKDIIITVEENKSAVRVLQIDIQSGQDHTAVNILQNR